MSARTKLQTVQTATTQASVTTLTNSGALAAVALAELAFDLSVWEREHAVATNAERKERAEKFLTLVRETAPGMSQADRDASLVVYEDSLRRMGKDDNTRAAMKSNYKVLINNATMIDVAESIKKNLKRIRDSLDTADEEQRAQVELEKKGKKYMQALEDYESAWEALEALKQARYIRGCAAVGDINQLPGKAQA